MKIYKRKFSSIVKSYFLNILAAFVFLIIMANLLDLLYALIATFLLYSYLMFQTFVKDKTHFELEGNKFRKIRGKKVLYEFDVKNQKINKETAKSIVGFSKMNIYIGNSIINASMLDLDDFNRLYTDLFNAAK